MWTTSPFTTSGVCLLEVTAVGLVCKDVWASWFVAHTVLAREGLRELHKLPSCCSFIPAAIALQATTREYVR